MPKDDRIIGLNKDLPEDLAKLAEKVAEALSKRRGGERRALLAYEFMNTVHVSVIQRVMLRGR